MESGINVAYKVIRIAQRDPERVPQLTPLKLQKLLFFIQGWYAVNRDDKRLIQEDFEAWQYGPVVRTVYNHFSSLGAGELTTLEVPSTIDSENEEEITKVLEVYGKMTPYELVKRTHEEKVWERNYNSPNNQKPLAEIKRTFKLKLVES